MAFPIDRHQFRSDDKLLFDTNVWVFIYGSQFRHPDRRDRLYSDAYKRILTTGCRIFIDTLILSEFVNVLSRLTYNSLPPDKKSQDFKKFRHSASFRIESGFTSVDIEAVLKGVEDGKVDFNDQILTQLCIRQGLTLVTNDGDFRGSELTIITGNQRLLA